MKTIKSIGCALLLICGAAGYAGAQGFYARFGVGYAFPQAGQALDGTGTPYSGTLSYSTYSSAYSLKSVSFSSGVQGTVGIGYLFNEHIGLQLDAVVGLSPSKYTFTNVNYQGTGIDLDYQMQANTPAVLIPSVVIQTGGDWNLYSRFGVALPISTGITFDNVYNQAPNGSSPEIVDITYQIKNSFTLGFAAAAGLKYALNEHTSIWGEISLLSMAPFIKELSLSALSVNGQGLSIDSISGPHTFSYSRNITVDSNGGKQPAYSQPFSNVGINVGVSFRLGDGSRRPRHSSGRPGHDADSRRKNYYR